MIVLDSSALVQALLNEATARTRVRHGELHAPFLIDAEVLSALRGHVLGGRISARDAESGIVDLELLALSRHPLLPLARRIWELRSNLTAYDACYVALAERLGCALVTADARIARASGPRCAIEVVS